MKGELEKSLFVRVIFDLEETGAAVKHKNKLPLCVFGWRDAECVNKNYFLLIVDSTLVLKCVA